MGFLRDCNGVLLLGVALSLFGAGVISSITYESGFYFDNGMGQTEVQFMDLEDQALLREEILTLLGLTHAPDKAVHRVDLREIGNHTIPHFMLEIYHSLTEDSSLSGEMRDEIAASDLLNNKFGITPDDVTAINDSDVIMSFANRGHQEDLQWTQLFWFDTAEIPPPGEESLLRAELRLYKGEADSDFDPDAEFIIKCYQLVEGSTGEANVLDSKTLRFRDQGWILLDVSKALRKWQFDYHANQGLMVEIVREDAPGQQLHPVAIGLATNREEHPDKEGFMVGFFKTLGDPMTRLYRQKRELEERRSKRSPKTKSKSSRNSHRNTKKKFSDIDEDFSYGGGSNVYSDFYGGRHRYRHCQKRMFKVSFRDLGWQDWIIAPDDYDAYYCHGKCSFPLNPHMNATNHAIVQTLIHLMNPNKVPEPCCAPNNLSAISVLYFDESSNVILKKYKNMVVKTCGCH